MKIAYLVWSHCNDRVLADKTHIGKTHTYNAFAEPVLIVRPLEGLLKDRCPPNMLFGSPCLFIGESKGSQKMRIKNSE